MKNLEKNSINIYKAFTTVITQNQRLKEANSELSDSEDKDEASNFQISDINFGKSNFQFPQLDKEFEPPIASIFNQNVGRNTGIQTKINLRKVLLLNRQSTMDLFCKSRFSGEEK